MPERKRISKRREVWESQLPAIDVIHAVKHLAAGEANADQQKKALHWILHGAGRLNRLSFHPVSERATAFAEGRRFVALGLSRIIRASIDELERELNQLKRESGDEDG